MNKISYINGLLSFCSLVVVVMTIMQLTLDLMPQSIESLIF